MPVDSDVDPKPFQENQSILSEVFRRRKKKHGGRSSPKINVYFTYYDEQIGDALGSAHEKFGV